MKQLTGLEKEFTSRRQSLFIATAAVKKSTNTPVGGKDIAGPSVAPSMGGKKPIATFVGLMNPPSGEVGEVFITVMLVALRHGDTMTVLTISRFLVKEPQV